MFQMRMSNTLDKALGGTAGDKPALTVFMLGLTFQKGSNLRPHASVYIICMRNSCICMHTLGVCVHR